MACVFHKIFLVTKVHLKGTMIEIAFVFDQTSLLKNKSSVIDETTPACMKWYPDNRPNGTIPKDTIPNDTIPNGHNPEWTQSRMDTIPNGHNPEWTQSRMDTIPNGHHPEWTRSGTDTIPNEHLPSY